MGNLFLNRRTITNPNEFFGRKNELRAIFSRISNLQSCDVYGERKIGKSSLLYYVFLKARDELGDDYKVAYIDLQDAHYQTINDFLKNSLKELDCKSEVIKTSNSIHENLIAFTESIKDFRVKKKPVLLLDEFEGLTKKLEFNNDVFDSMRSLGNGNIAYVTASLHSLKTLCIEGNFTSPFYNIFYDIPLGNFSPEETTEFLSLKRDEIGFNDREIEFIYEIANNHPLHLQIACYHIYEHKGKNWNESKLRNDIEKEIRSFDHSEIIEKRSLSNPDIVLKKESLSVDDTNKRERPQTKQGFIDLIDPAATIAAFAGFIILEMLEIYPTGYNKHIISIVIASIIFLIIFVIRRK